MKYFTHEQIDNILEAYVMAYPDAIDRMHSVMRHPFRKNDQKIHQIYVEIGQISEKFDFFKEYSEHEPRAFLHLIHDVSDRVAQKLGQIGSYKTEE